MGPPDAPPRGRPRAARVAPLLVALLAALAPARCAACGSIEEFDEFDDGFDVTHTGATDVCYRIEPSPAGAGARVWLVFQNLEMPTGELTVYDGASFEGHDALYQCIGCGAILPPPLLSSGGALLLRYKQGSSSSVWENRLHVEWVTFHDAMIGLHEVELRMARGELVAPADALGGLPRGIVFKWSLRPYQPTGGGDGDVTLVVTAANLTDGATLTVEDGDGETVLELDDANAAARPGGDLSRARWVATGTGSLQITLRTLEAPALDLPLGRGAFSAYFFSDANTCHQGTHCNCGAAYGVDELRAPAMGLSDGSPAAERQVERGRLERAERDLQAARARRDPPRAR